MLITGAWRLGRRPQLDGLRGAAILMVLACHVGSYDLGGYDRFHALGSAGVEMFFALSGFLITAMLVQERRDSGRVSIARFYSRRARRLFPALVAMGLAVVTIQRLCRIELAPAIWPVALYVANWTQLGGLDLGALDPTWSLSIEEQFYVAWPILFVLSVRWRHGPLVVAAVGLTLSTCARLALALHGHGGDRAYYGSDTQAASLLVGCLLALLTHRGLPRWQVRPSLPAIGVLAMAGWSLTSARWIGDVLVPTVVPAATAVLIWVACSSPGGLLEARWLRYVGRRSYALYLWHLPVIWILIACLGASLGSGLVAIAATVVVAEISWRLVEKPFLRGGSPEFARSGDDVSRRIDPEPASAPC